MERKEPGRPLRLALLALAAAFYAALALIYLRPVWRVWQDRIAPNTEDPLFNLWILKWGVHQARLGFPGFWDANVYWPTRGALALSDHLLGPALQMALFESAVPNAIAGYNVLFFTSFVLTGLAVCWVLRRSGASWTGAAAASVVGVGRSTSAEAGTGPGAGAGPHAVPVRTASGHGPGMFPGPSAPRTAWTAMSGGAARSIMSCAAMARCSGVSVSPARASAWAMLCSTKAGEYFTSWRSVGVVSTGYEVSSTMSSRNRSGASNHTRIVSSRPGTSGDRLRSVIANVAW